MESFRSLSKIEIFDILDEQWQGLMSAAEQSKIEAKRRNDITSRKLSNSVSAIANLIESLHIEIENDSLQITPEFKDMLHDEMLMTMYEHLCEQHDKLSDIESQRQTDKRGTALRNKRNEIAAGLDSIEELIMAFGIDLTEFKETMSDYCKIR